jgi:putative ABC transport system permease protein
MLRNYFKTTWRNMTRTPGHIAINILGFGIAMSVVLTIGLGVYEQYRFERLLANHGRLYRVQRNFYSNGDSLTVRTTSLKLSDALRAEIPEIQLMTVF